MKSPAIVLALTSILSLTACHASEETAHTKAAQANSNPNRPSVLNPPSREADDAARFLAGLPGREGSPYKTLEADPGWISYSKNINELWGLYENRRKPGMQKFQKAELVGPPVDGSPVWYPFSGADALTMMTYFPGHQTYVMAALEPPGMVPRPEDFPAGEFAHKLPGIGATLESLLSKSFFVTREMDRQLRGQVTDGITDPLLIQLARLNYRILSHTYVQVDESGKLVGRALDAKRAAFGRNRGIALEIQRDGEAPALLCYVSLNLDNNHMKDNPGFAAYIASLGKPSTMLKATSYMLHSNTFSIIRDMILTRSGLIVQDDSGIPWRFFQTPEWQVQLYGDYVKPFGKDFAFRAQADLREAYETQRSQVKPIEFRMGYGAGRVTSNLQVARRR
jgi:hypothetical protein